MIFAVVTTTTEPTTTTLITTTRGNYIYTGIVYTYLALRSSGPF